MSSITNINNDWEISDTGAATNGGCFDRTSGNTDYSQQDVAELTLTDVATDGAGTGISSVTGGFTAAMVDNGAYLSGTSADRYQIVAVADTNNATIDRDAGASQSGLTCNVGGAISTLTDAVSESFYKGNRVYFKKGTYVLTENVLCSVQGSATDGYLQWIGYNATRGDDPTVSADMPHISCGAYYLQINAWNLFRNIRKSGTAAYVLYAKNRTRVSYCIIQNTSTGFGVYTDATTHFQLILSEIISTVGTALSAAFASVSGCDIHSSSIGTVLSGGSTLADSQIYGCSTTGIGLTGSNSNVFVKNVTIDDCTVGIDASGSAFNIPEIINSNITNCTTGVSASVVNHSIYLDYNNYHGNGTDVVNVFKGDNATATNPNYANAAGGDFANDLPANALPKTTFPAGITENSLSQGASQQAAGGTGGGSFGFVS